MKTLKSFSQSDISEFVFGLQTLRKSLQTKGIAKKGAAEALNKVGFQKLADKSLKSSNKSIQRAARLNKLDKTLTKGILGTDVGKASRNFLSNARTTLNKKTGILGTDVKNTKQLITNRGQSSSLKSLQANQARALAASNNPIPKPDNLIKKEKIQRLAATQKAKQKRKEYQDQLNMNPFMA